MKAKPVVHKNDPGAIPNWRPSNSASPSWRASWQRWQAGWSWRAAKVRLGLA